MESFAGYYELGDTIYVPLLTRASTTLVPTNADSNPTFVVYGYDGTAVPLTGQSGTAAKRHTFTVTDATNATPIVITTSAAHNLATGQVVTISGVVGNTAANATHKITVASATTFSLTTLADVSVAGNGAYVSGGTGNVTGFYYIQLTLGAAYEAGKTYSANVTYQVSSTGVGECVNFVVT